MLEVNLKERYLEVLPGLNEWPEELKDITSTVWNGTPVHMRLCFLSLYDYAKELEERVKLLTSKAKSLEGLLNLNSTNSSLPPSSDSSKVKAKRPKAQKSKRKPGGQPGHKGHYRPLLDESMVNEIKDYYPDSCSCCGNRLPPNPANKDYIRHQVSEIEPIKVKVFEYRFHKVECAGCQAKNIAPWPKEVPRSAFGPYIQAKVGTLTGSYGLSKLQTQSYFEDFYSMHISTASIIAIEKKMSKTIIDPVDKIREAIRNAEVLYIDETGWTVANKKAWLWTFVSHNGVFYYISPKRNQKVLNRVLGYDYKGVVVSDRYSVYNLFPVKRRGVCWAHLKRDFIRYSEMEGEKGEFGSELLELTEKVFEVWQEFKTKEITRNLLQEKLSYTMIKMANILQEAEKSKDKKLAKFAGRLNKLWPALWNFSKINGVEPTNNAAERALRRPVIFRKLSFGNKSWQGAKFMERIYSIMATCKKQTKSLLHFLSELLQEQYSKNTSPAPT